MQQHISLTYIFMRFSDYFLEEVTRSKITGSNCLCIFEWLVHLCRNYPPEIFYQFTFLPARRYCPLVLSFFLALLSWLGDIWYLIRVLTIPSENERFSYFIGHLHFPFVNCLFIALSIENGIFFCFFFVFKSS